VGPILELLAPYQGWQHAFGGMSFVPGLLNEFIDLASNSSIIILAYPGEEEDKMDQFFTGDYTGAPFELFGPAHLIALSVVVLINLLIFIFRKRFTEEIRKVFRYSLAAVLIVDEVGWHLWNYTTGKWSIQETLPLHLCSVFVFLSAYMLVTRSFHIYEYAYFLGIAGASQALLTPDAGIYGFPHFRFFQVIVSHGSIVTAALYFTFVEGFRPYLHSFKRVFIGANIYMLFVGGINAVLGSNYLFIARKPDTASLMDVLGPWPWYILSLEVVGVLLCLLLYLPFALKDRKVTPQPAVIGT
jgi:hypothetical integral membrane protein (TIGR02206 family)